MNEWKTIDSRCNDRWVIAARYDGKVREAKFCTSRYLWIERNGNYWGTNAATHYMELPQPPKQDQGHDNSGI